MRVRDMKSVKVGDERGPSGRKAKAFPELYTMEVGETVQISMYGNLKYEARVKRLKNTASYLKERYGKEFKIRNKRNCKQSIVRRIK